MNNWSVMYSEAVDNLVGVGVFEITSKDVLTVAGKSAAAGTSTSPLGTVSP